MSSKRKGSSNSHNLMEMFKKQKQKTECSDITRKVQSKDACDDNEDLPPVIPCEEDIPVGANNGTEVVAAQVQKDSELNSEDENEPCRSSETQSTANAIPLKDHSTKARKQGSGFKSEWKVGRPWLVYEVVDGSLGMFCLLCRKFNKMPFDRDVWIKSPCVRLRRGSVVDHENSASHKDAVQLEMCSSLTQNVESVICSSVRKKDVMDTFACLYFLCKQRMAHTVNFEPLLSLTTFLGLTFQKNMHIAKNATYSSDTVIQEMLYSISAVLETRILKTVVKSPFFAIELDESSDVSMNEQLVLHLRYVDERALRNNFLKVITLMDVSNVDGPETDCRSASLDASAVANAVIQYLKKNSEYLPVSKMCGLGSDGAPVLTGKVNGALKKICDFQEEEQSMKKSSCKAVTVHCACHRLNLAASQAAQSVPQVKKFNEILRQMYDFFQNSTVRLAGLKLVQELLFEECAKCIQPSYTRWLSHGEATLRLKRIYPSVILSLEREAEERSDARACGLLSFMTTRSFIDVMLLMCDVLPLLNKLSKLFQKEDSDLTIVVPLVQSTVRALQNLKDHDGPNSQEVNSFIEQQCQRNGINITEKGAVTNFKLVKCTFINTLLENIANRFTDAAVLQDFVIFDPKRLPNNSSEMISYGDESIRRLSNRFGLTVEESEQEWRLFKQFMSDSYKKKSYSEVIKCLCSSENLEGVFPNIIALSKGLRAIPLHSADCERDFSAMKLVKTVLRNRMKEETLDALLRITIDGPPVDQFPYEEAVQHWYSQKPRRIRLK